MVIKTNVCFSKIKSQTDRNRINIFSVLTFQQFGSPMKGTLRIMKDKRKSDRIKDHGSTEKMVINIL